MLVQCPECNTKYNLSAEQIGPGGRKVRCTRCKHVFVAPAPQSEPEADLVADLVAEPQSAPEPVKPELPHEPEPAADAEASFEDELESLFQEQLTESVSPRQQQTQPEPVRSSARSEVDEAMVADLQGAFQQPLIERPTQHDFDAEETEAKAEKSNWFLITVLILLLLIIGIGGAVYYRALWMPAPNATSAEAPPAVPVTVPESAAQIALENVRQYFVPNEKEGQLFIIEGKAVNRFAEPRELIRLKASLFDKQGLAVSDQEFVCGNVVSLYQLQVASRKDIEDALTAKVGILTNNTNVQPGAAVPFMAVFFNAPDTVEEFGLEVLQSSLSGK